MGVTDRGLRAWKRRPPSLRQRRDLILLAHIREQHRLCLGSYGRPRMTEELKALGLQVGQRRVGRLMRQNNITVVRTRKFKRTTDSHHTFNIAPNLLKQDFSASAPNQKWAGDITYVTWKFPTVPCRIRLSPSGNNGRRWRNCGSKGANRWMSRRCSA
ncbi:hypothetical protein EVV94_00005 [Enterobacter cloacae]|nr:hypothetical protein EVV94_00005 [Enterobacter cloacae]